MVKFYYGKAMAKVISALSLGWHFVSIKVKNMTKPVLTVPGW